MLRQARTPAERADAERAVDRAERGLVSAPLRASGDGAVLSHAASRGDRVAEDQEILSIEDARSVGFVAEVSQGDLGRIAPGQPASIEIGGRAAPLSGSVHAILPAANPADFTARVRIDFRGDSGRLATGLFGTARVRVGQRRDVLVVPDAAAVRDDVAGTTRVATVRSGELHWVSVERGIEQGGRHRGRFPGALARAAGRRLGAGRPSRGRAGRRRAMSLLEASRRRSAALFLLLLLLCAAGAWTAARLPSSLFPSVTFPIVKVIADVGEEPAARMMPTVTRPLEEAVLRVPGIRLRALDDFARLDRDLGRVRVGHGDADGAPADGGRDLADPARPARRRESGRRVDEHGDLSDPRVRADVRDRGRGRRSADARRVHPEAGAHPDPGRRAGPGAGRARSRSSRCGSTRAALEARKLAPSDVVDAIRKNNQVLSAGLTERNHELYLSLVDGRAHGLEALERIPCPSPAVRRRGSRSSARSGPATRSRTSGRPRTDGRRSSST